MTRALLFAAALCSCSSESAAPGKESEVACDDRSVLTEGGCVVVGITEPIATSPPACERGTFAIPGEETCHAPSTIPLEGVVLHVDAAAADGGDGSKARPFRTLASALGSAPVDAVLALAAGTYRENVRIAKTVSLVGVDPTKVAIVGSGDRPTIDVAASATIAGVSITGTGIGVAVTSGTARIVGALIHDTGSVGVNVSGAAAIVERSLVESAAYAGVAGFGAELEVVGSAIRDTRFLDGRGGPGVLAAHARGKRPKLTVRDSVIERSHEVGVGVAGGDLVLESTVIRETEAMADGTVGTGVLASKDRTSGATPTLLIRTSLITGSRESGIAINGGEGTIEQTHVDDTRLRARDNFYGVGIQADPTAKLAIRNSLVTRSRHMGIAYFAAEGTIESTIVRETLLEGDNRTAIGVAIADVDGVRSNVTLTRALVDRNELAGISVVASDATFVECSVRRTAPRADGTFGDGVVALATDAEHRPNLTIDGLTADKNARAGVTVFGGSVTMRRSKLTCNPFDLNVEAYPAPVSMIDTGENVCGCGQPGECTAASNTLQVQVAPARGGG